MNNKIKYFENTQPKETWRADRGKQSQIKEKFRNPLTKIYPAIRCHLLDFSSKWFSPSLAYTLTSIFLKTLISLNSFSNSFQTVFYFIVNCTFSKKKNVGLVYKQI